MMFSLRSVYAAALAVCCLVNVAHGQRNRQLDRATRERNIRIAQERLKEAQGRLENAKKQVSKARKDAKETVGPYNSAKKAFEEAKDALRRSRTDETEAVLKLREDSPIQNKIALVKKTAKEIAERRETLREKILAELAKKSPAYKKIKADHEKIKSELSASPTPRPDLSKRMLEVGSQVGKAEAEALSANAEYKALLNEAKQNHAQLAELDKALADSIATDPKRIAAAKAVDAALANYKQKLAELNKQEIARQKVAKEFSEAVSNQKSAEKEVRQRQFQLSAAKIR